MARRAVSIIVPAFNEGLELDVALERVRAFADALSPERYFCELVLVDDGSVDETASVIAAFVSRYPQTRVVTHEANRGLSEALVSGIRAATGEAIAILDADLSYAPGIIEPLLETLFGRGASVVVASPYMAGGRVGNVPWDRLVASRGANYLLSALVGGRIKTFTGMVRAYDGPMIRAIVTQKIRGEFNAGILAEILRRNGSIVEIPAELIWPTSRRASPSRLTLAKLWARVRLVLSTAQVLLGSLRASRSRTVL